MKKDNEKQEVELEPFGKEWKKEMMRMDKLDLVNILKKVAIENVNQQMEIRSLERLTGRTKGRIKKAFTSLKPKTNPKNQKS